MVVLLRVTVLTCITVRVAVLVRVLKRVKVLVELVVSVKTVVIVFLVGSRVEQSAPPMKSPMMSVTVSLRYFAFIKND